MDSDSITIKKDGAASKDEFTLKLDGSRQEMPTAHGKKPCTPSWEGEVLVVRTEDGPTTRRFMKGDLMCLELTMGNVTVTKQFRKKE